MSGPVTAAPTSRARLLATLPVAAAAAGLAAGGVARLAGAPFEMRATAAAAASTYAAIVRLVEAAETSKAPLVRLADRWAAWLLAATAVLPGGAWVLTGEPRRALAVLVVATPCPLLLAAPAAIVAGISRAARNGIIVKGGGALEALAGARALLLDKTGTVTTGRPRVGAVEVFALPAEPPA